MPEMVARSSLYRSVGNNIFDSAIQVKENGRDSYFEETLRLTFPRSLPPEYRFVAVLHGYFDDSGTHPESDCVVIAGFLSLADKWITFDEQWYSALDDFGLEYFHMADFAGGYREYQNWAPEMKEKRLARLLGIIDANTLVSTGIGIPRNAFDENVKNVPFPAFANAYSFAAIWCIDAVSSRFKKILAQRRFPVSEMWVSYRFEDGTKGKGEILQVYDWIKQDPKRLEESRILSIGFEDKRKVRPLQAADMLAHELYRDFIRKSEEPESATLAAFGSRPHLWVKVPEETIRNMAFKSQERAIAYLMAHLHEIA